MDDAKTLDDASAEAIARQRDPAWFARWDDFCSQNLQPMMPDPQLWHTEMMDGYRRRLNEARSAA
jgi:hypothetical protein